MADVLECSLNARVPPARILAGHADDQFGDDLHDPRPTGRPALVGPLLSNDLPVPTEDGVGSDESRDLGECPSADCFAAHRKASPLSVGQSKSPTTELLFENAVLFLNVFDDRVLLASDPSGHGGYEDLPWMEDRCHLVIVARSRTDRQLST